MKKLLTLLFLAALVITAIVSCDITSPKTTPKPNSGDFKAILNPDIVDEALDEFMKSYSRYGLKIVASLQPDNRFRFVFNKRTIDKHTLLDILKEDCRIKYVDFNEIDLVWWSHRVMFQYNIQLVENKTLFFIELETTFSSWEFKHNKEYFPIDLPTAVFDFNHLLVEDFEVIQTLRKDPRMHIVY